MFAKFPRSPSDSAPQPRRRIRCKMCRLEFPIATTIVFVLRVSPFSRQELAAREHMLDHGQLGPPTPAVLSAAPSRRPSINDAIKPTAGGPVARRTSAGGSRPIVGLPGMSRKPSTREPLPRSRLDSITEGRSLRSSLVVLDTTAEVGRSVSDLTDSAIDDGDSPDEEPPKSDSAEGVPSHAKLGADVAAAANDSTSFAKKATLADRAAEVMITPSLQPSQNLAHPSDLAAQLASHPKLSALCSPTGLAMTTMTPTVLTPQSPVLTSVKNYFQAPSPPILANPKCSGYFVEPVSMPRVLWVIFTNAAEEWRVWQMKWMEPFLEQGHMAGKIICPNKKCGVKLGNYDWAGVCCSCKEWVVPVCGVSWHPLFVTDLELRSGILHPPLKGGRDGVNSSGLRHYTVGHSCFLRFTPIVFICLDNTTGSLKCSLTELRLAVLS